MAVVLSIQFFFSGFQLRDMQSVSPATRPTDAYYCAATFVVGFKEKLLVALDAVLLHLLKDDLA